MSIIEAVVLLIVVAVICAILNLPYLILGVTAVLVLLAFLFGGISTRSRWR